jgi:flavodoxin
METLSGRRDFFQRALLLTTVSSAATAARGNPTTAMVPSPNQVLVAYLSRSGNTRVVAGQIARAQTADVFEIQALQPYPEDYRQTVEQAAREAETGFEPQLKATVLGMERYRIVFLGFPIWGMTAPPPIRSFLTRHNLTGKIIVPFITHGGYGTGRSLAVLAQLAPRARIADAFVMQADQERDTLERVTNWLQQRPGGR